MIKLPEMTVEKRNSKTAHGLRRPTLPGNPAFEEQLRHVLEFVEAAKVDSGFPTELLKIYDPIKNNRNGYSNALGQFGFRSWKQTTAFVKDDECNEFFVRVAKWAKSNSIPLRPEIAKLGFIDGSGFGIQFLYLALGKIVLEKGFDAKYYFYQRLKTKRPLERFLERLRFVCPALFNYIHPGHPRYPAGHSCKFFAAVLVAMLIWDIPEQMRLDLLTTAYVLSMSRTGGGVHLPEDNLAGGYFAWIPEYQFMGKEQNTTLNPDLVKAVDRAWQQAHETIKSLVA